MPVTASFQATDRQDAIPVPTRDFSAISAPRARQTFNRSAAQPASDTAREERALVLAYIRDYAAEFHDIARLSASVTRAHRLLTRSGAPFERWTEKLQDAHR